MQKARYAADFSKQRAQATMRLAYSALFILLLPAILLRMLLRSRRAPAYRRRLAERFGVFPVPRDSRPGIWIHAVSLGETLAARPLIERLLAEWPNHRLIVTTTTPTGSAQVQNLFAGRVLHVYAPWDTPGAVKRFLGRVKPDLLVLMETELWPNMLHYSRSTGCRIMLANARLSARSAAGYARFPLSTRAMLDDLDWIGAQSAGDADRFAQLGMDPARISVTGSIKFDVRLDQSMHERATELRQQWQLAARPVVIMASTHEGEEAIALRLLRDLRAAQSNALMLLAPRHPERFETAYEQCRADGWRVARCSRGDAPDLQTDVLLVDTLGQLLQLFGVADLAVIGGSFFDRGGHNPLEAAAWGIPVLCGPSMYNFEDIARRLADEGALIQCENVEHLLVQLPELLRDEVARGHRGAAALAVMEANRGALDALDEVLNRLLAAHR
jgi:3-deoxy-D-manno-octulosonic-acid transferase